METKKRGRWNAGESGNPAGRKPGTGTIGKLREGIAAHLPQIIDRLVTAAKAGDTQASRLLLERVLPAVKAVGQPVRLSLPNGNITEQAAAIVRAAADSEISPDQASELLTCLSSLARIREIDEIENRLSTLEIAAQIRKSLAAIEESTGNHDDA